MKSPLLWQMVADEKENDEKEWSGIDYKGLWSWIYFIGLINRCDQNILICKYSDVNKHSNYDDFLEYNGLLWVIDVCQ